VVALVVGVLGATGVMSIYLNIGYVIPIVAVILFIVSLVEKNRTFSGAHLAACRNADRSAFLTDPIMRKC